MSNEIQPFDEYESKVRLDLFKLTESVSAAIYWTEFRNGKEFIVENGTCSFVDTGSGLFGVTAAHVISRYNRYKNEFPHTPLYVGGDKGLMQGVEVIDIIEDELIDVATFKISQKYIDHLGVLVVDHAIDEWPQPLPRKSDLLILSGYPTKEITPFKDVFKLMLAQSTLTMTDFDKGRIVMELRRENLRLLPGQEPREFREGLEGCSGCPLLRYDRETGNIGFSGVFTDFGATDAPDGGATAYAIPARIINPDGTLRR